MQGVPQALLRTVLLPLAAAVVTLSLFWLMVVLTSTNRPDFASKEPPSLVDFIRIKQEQDAVQVRERRPERKEPPKPPPRPAMRVAEQEAPAPQSMPKMPIPELSTLMDLGFGSMLAGVAVGGTASVSTDQQLIPLVRVPPKYPMKASLDGIEGWVKLAFTITETGAVKDVSVVASKPRRIFDRAARRAISKWRFKPQVIDGKAVPRKAVQTLEFKLQG